MAIFFHFFVHNAHFYIKILSILNPELQFISFFPQFYRNKVTLPFLK